MSNNGEFIDALVKKAKGFSSDEIVEAKAAKVMRGLNGCKKTETTSTVFGKMYKTNATSKGDARCS